MQSFPIPHLLKVLSHVDQIYAALFGIFTLHLKKAKVILILLHLLGLRIVPYPMLFSISSFSIFFSRQDSLFLPLISTSYSLSRDYIFINAKSLCRTGILA